MKWLVSCVTQLEKCLPTTQCHVGLYRLSNSCGRDRSELSAAARAPPLHGGLGATRRSGAVRSGAEPRGAVRVQSSAPRSARLGYVYPLYMSCNAALRAVLLQRPHGALHGLLLHLLQHVRVLYHRLLLVHGHLPHQQRTARSCWSRLPPHSPARSGGARSPRAAPQSLPSPRSGLTAPRAPHVEQRPAAVLGSGRGRARGMPGVVVPRAPPRSPTQITRRQPDGSRRLFSKSNLQEASAEKETAQALQQYSCQYIQQYERIRKERESFGTEHRRYSQSISINGLILQMAENS